MAAHLHDSVLQTLALIQKNSGDATTVARLARAQERDLRTWLFEGEATDDTTLAGALRDVAASVEETHPVVVDVVTVGDCADSEAVRTVAAGDQLLAPAVTRRLVEHFVATRRPSVQVPAAVADLTPREREVLALMAEGRSNTAIARRIVVTEGAVEKHVRNIFTKLDLPPDTEQHRRVLAVLAYLRE